MPASKHRQKGKYRPRGNIKILVFPPLTFDEDPETLREDRLIQERLRQLYGEGDWDPDEFEDAIRQLEAEGKSAPPANCRSELPPDLPAA